MLITQCYGVVNDLTGMALGKTDILQEDLSNIADVGRELIDISVSFSWMGHLVDHIGKMVFRDKKYAGSAPSVIMDAWEYGGILEKVRIKTPTAVENSSWSLSSGSAVDNQKFTAPEIVTRFYNKRVTFDIDMSFTEKQIKTAFDNATQLNSFLSMIYTAIENSMTIKMDSLILATLSKFIGITIANDLYPKNETGQFTGTVDLSTVSGIKAVNLLKLYNARFGTTLTKANCITEEEFIKFASYTIGLYSTRMSKISSLFNIGGQDNFTPQEDMRLILLSEFAKSADVYLQSSTFHNEFTSLPTSDIVPYWTGSGKDYAFANTSKISMTTCDYPMSDWSNLTITTDGILGVMFDKESLGVSCLDRRTTSAYNAKGEFVNQFYKMDAGYYIDPNENFVVFYVA